MSAGAACALKQPSAGRRCGWRVALGGDVGAPAALHAVELQQVRGGRGAALDLVEVHHLQPVARARVVLRALGRAHGRAQRQPADAAHAVDAD
jgi:hypothetical protein